MSTTNHTQNYELSQYVDNDVTSYLTNYNSDMTKIDAQMKRNADSAQTAEDNATIAVSTATNAASNASTALNTANSANETAESAQTAAQNAQTASVQAQTDAASALRASASNSIANLAPAYDPTLTYEVGDLVTYIFSDTNHGHLYKCIVAVSTPEDFDVNKWDDVTTSEVYAHSKKELASVTCDGVMTAKEALDYLGTVISNISFGTNLILLYTAASGSISVFKLEKKTGTGLTFTSVSGGGERRAYITSQFIGYSNNSSRGYTEFDTQTGTMSAIENSSTVESSGIKYAVIEY